MNPLEMPDIVGQVVKYLNKADLIGVRLVNKTWEKSANRFLGKFSIFLADRNPNDETWKEFMINFGPYLETLTITTHQWTEYMRNPGYFYHFKDILHQLPRLTHLYFDIAIWSRVKWTSVEGEAGSVRRLNSNSLRTIELLRLDNPQVLNRRIHPNKSLWNGPNRETLDWCEQPIWSIFVNIVKSAPNLKTLRTAQDNFVPQATIEEIFKSDSPIRSNFKLKSLELGAFGTADRTNFEFNKIGSNFFPILCKNQIISNLKRLRLPRPDAEFVDQNSTAWNELFDWISKTLQVLKVGAVSVKDVLENMQPKTDLPRIEFRTTMRCLKSLTLHVSMFSRQMATHALFPVLDYLTLIVDDVEELGTICEADRAALRDDLELLDRGIHRRPWSVSKLSILVTDESYEDRYEATKLLFQMLLESVPNTKSVELRSCLLYEGFRSFFEVYGANAQMASQVETLRITDFCDYRDVSGEVALVMTAVLDNHSPFAYFRRRIRQPVVVNVNLPTLKSFPNLRTFAFGFPEYNANFIATRHFFHNSVLQMKKLTSLELINLGIENEALAYVHDVGDLSEFKYSECFIHYEDDDD